MVLAASQKFLIIICFSLKACQLPTSCVTCIQILSFALSCYIVDTNMTLGH